VGKVDYTCKNVAVSFDGHMLKEIPQFTTKHSRNFGKMPPRPPFDPLVLSIHQLAELGKKRRIGFEELEEGLVNKLRKVSA
jgi:hypothetical protein